MSADTGTFSSGSDDSVRTPATGFRGVLLGFAAIPIELGRACAWLFDLLQRSNTLYSLKTFGAGMLALFISLALDLSQPGWSLMTVYIVSQPLSGMVISKSLARVGGTLAGALMSVVLIATVGDVRELFVVCMALWIGLCLYISICLREAPASYGAMLAGYTAAIVGFPAAIAPESTFSIVTARCIEVTLGIILATLASQIILPRSTARVFRMRVAAVLNDMQRSITSTLAGHFEDTKALAALRKLIADSVALESLRIHASRESGDGHLAGDVVRALQARLLSLSSLLVSIHDRVAILRRERPEAARELAPLLTRAGERVEMLAHPENWKARRPSGGGAGSGSLTTDLLAKLPNFEAMRNDPQLVVEYNILLRLLDLLAQWQEVNRLKAFLFSDMHGKTAADANILIPPAEDRRIMRYRDHSLAMVASFGAVAAVLLASLFWITTGWTHGSTAATFAGVVSCIMAVQDNPARSALRFLNASIGSIICAAILMLVILPRAHDFGGLMLGFGLFIIPLGMLVPTPRFGAYATPLLLHTIAFSSLQSTLSTDFAEFLNSCTALILGMAGGMLCFRLLRPVGADWPVRRLTSGMMRDLAQLTASADAEHRTSFETRMLDRISAITVRLRMDNPDDRAHLQGSFTVLRMGLNNLLLLRQLPSLPPRLARATRAALDELAVHFAQRAEPFGMMSRQVRTNPIPAIDLAIQSALDAGPDAHAEALNVLVSLRAVRSTLSQHSGFYGLEGKQQ